MSNEIVGAQYVYITIPKSDVKLYHRIMSLMADYGEAKLKDCTAECFRNNQLVINSYNMFNAAIAAKNREDNVLYNTLIKYVTATIDNLYKGQSEDSLDFIYESDSDGNVLLDIENGILITQDSMWSIIPYTAPRLIDHIEYSIESVVFDPYSVPAAGGNVQRPQNTPTYVHKKTIYYQDGGEPMVVDGGAVTARYTLVSGSFSVDANGNLSGIEASTIESLHTIGQVKLTLTTAAPDTGYEGASVDKTVDVKQQAYVEPNRLVYAEIPITQQERISINADSSTIVNYITASKISTYKILDTQYITADNSIATTNDVIQITGRTVGNYIQVFLIKKTHTVVGYDELGGSSANLYQKPIEELNTYTTKKIVDNYSDYDNSIFRAVFLIDKQDSIKQFKIQIKNT